MRVTYKELSARRFGVELELSNNLSKKEIGKYLGEYELIYGGGRGIVVTTGAHGWAHTTANDYWHVKYDSTCGPEGKGHDFGWEVASFIGSGPKDMDHVARGARYLANVGGLSNVNCGLHIHVETTDYTPSKMGLLLARWLKVEEAVLNICNSSRRKNPYCQTIRGRYDQKKASYDPLYPDEFWYGMQPNDLGVHNNYEKRYSINPIGFAISLIKKDYNRNTVELRLPECLLNEAHVRNWTRLFVNFVESCTDLSTAPPDLAPAKTLTEALYYLGLGGRSKEIHPRASVDELEFYIFDNELLSTKMWFLRKTATCHSFEAASQAYNQLDFIGSL
jgi:hypothetical protein